MKEYKEENIKRRDERQTKISDEPTQSLKPSSKKKDTKKWCKGKIGVEHQLKCVKYTDAKNLDHIRPRQISWRILVCTVCGKELEIYYGRTTKPKPDWVDV